MKVILTSVAAAIFILAAANANAAAPAEITCSQALANAGQVKVGMSEARVLELLGKPTDIENGVWSYNFWPCAPPPKVGVQAVLGIGLEFKNKAVTKIGYATICATGP